MEVTMMVVRKQKKMKVTWAGLSQRAKPIPHTVCALRARRFTSMATAGINPHSRRSLRI
jgi:hypothetical protein